MTTSGVASPCIDICRMDPRSGLCEGCLRTLDEIAAWGTLSDAGKLAVWQRLEQRRRGAAVPATPGTSTIKQATG
jgi:hypothetical protein